MKRDRLHVFVAILLGIISLSTVFLLPHIISMQVRQQQKIPAQAGAHANDPNAGQFPISVNPATKSITENPKADAFFENNNASLTASLGSILDVINWIAALIANTGLYQSLAAADGHLIVIKAGYRKEEVIAQLSNALNWNAQEEKQFRTAIKNQYPALDDGIFAPGDYVLDNTMTPDNVAAVMDLQFTKTIVSHYGTTTAAFVPMSQALTVASLLEREARSTDDMRMISGIIWNRLFNNMNLQIDATLQYAKGENHRGNWWQRVVPKDKFIASPYNTYANPGLPPGPIANPSVAAVVAALNPVNTTCLFYFHDRHGNFHCADTYKQHVALLKKYYGQGK